MAPTFQGAHFELYSAAGNRFAVFDLLRAALPTEPALLARGLCGDDWPSRKGFRPDGLLLFAPASPPALCAMILYNADGTRPEACGNGLRVIGDYALRSGHAEPGEILVETDSGVRRLELSFSSALEPRVRALVAHPRILEQDLPLEIDGETQRGIAIDAGNPHCVIFVEDPSRHDLDRLGRALQIHPRFPAGVNVELVARTATGWSMRVFERGVGETASCGTGACAVALAGRAVGRALEGAIAIDCKGGRLIVDFDHAGAAWLSGPLEYLSSSSTTNSGKA